MIHPANVPLGYYVDKTTPVHTAPVGVKFVVLATFLIGGAIFSTTWLGAGICIAITALGYLTARIPLTVALRQLIGPVPILLLFALLLWWRISFTQAAITFVVLLSAIGAAILFTLTTRVSEVLDALTRALRPFERWGLPVDTIALALSLTIRMVPLQVQNLNEVLEARKARGASTSITAFGVPLIVRTVRRSRAIADALIARGKAD